MKPIKLYSHAQGPNPWKCVIIMEELGIPYETEFVDFSVIKQVSPFDFMPTVPDAYWYPPPGSFYNRESEWPCTRNP